MWQTADSLTDRHRTDIADKHENETTTKPVDGPKMENYTCAETCILKYTEVHTSIHKFTQIYRHVYTTIC